MTPPAQLSDLDTVVRSLISGLLPLVGAVAIVMIVVGGFNFFSAGGDKEGTARAQKTITYALLGLILAISAWLIISILGRFLGANFNDFSVMF